MLGHYLRMAARGFVRHKLYTFINVVGLSVALACAILIVLFVKDQLSYDAWIPGTQNLYRLAATFYLPGSPPLHLTGSSFPVLTAVGQKIPQVKAVVHVAPERMTVMEGDFQAPEMVTVVDRNFFQVLRIPFVEGDPMRALAQPESVVLSEAMAHKYFGTADPVGKVLRVSGKLIDFCKPRDVSCYGVIHPLTVTGVIRDLPHETQLVADFVVPNGSQADEIAQWEKDTFWTATLGTYGYVQLLPGARPAAVLAALKPILDASVDFKDLGLKARGSSAERYTLVPFRDVHLDNDKYGGMTPGGNRATVYGFAVPVGTSVRFLRAAGNFAPLYGIRLLAGRLPSETEDDQRPAPGKELNILVNAEAARLLGYSPDQALGRIFSTGSVFGRLRVIGVLDNVAIGGVRGLPQPTVYLPDSGQAAFLSVRVRAGELAQALGYIDKVWRSVAPSVAMDRYFLTDAFNDQFAADEKQGKMFAVFVIVTVLIGCLGLFGLAVFTAERRTKEIGVRKVSGARTNDIMRLMLWRISLPVLAANIVAWPVAYYYLHGWLEQYAYRITLSPAYFLGAGAVALIIAWATVYANTLRLARTNPIHALRYE